MPHLVFALTGVIGRNSRALRQLRVLRSLGFSVTVLGFDQTLSDEMRDLGITLVAVPRPRGGGPRFFWATHRRIAGALRTVEGDIYHASDLYVLPAMARAARRQKARLAFDAREMYPYVASTSGRPWVSLAWHLVQDRYISRTDAVFTVSDSIADWLATTYGIERPVVLYNVPDYPRPDHPSDVLRERLNIPRDHVVVLHQGSIQKDRGCALLAAAMADVEGATLVFLGDGPLRSSLESSVRHTGPAARILFLDPVPPDELLTHTASADIGVTLLEDTCLNHRYALPNKLFEYVTAGIPVLASDLPEIRKVVATFPVGLTVDPSDRTALAGRLRELVENPDLRSRLAAAGSGLLETFSAATTSEVFRDAYLRLVETAP